MKSRDVLITSDDVDRPPGVMLPRPPTMLLISQSISAVMKSCAVAVRHSLHNCQALVDVLHDWQLISGRGVNLSLPCHSGLQAQHSYKLHVLLSLPGWTRASSFLCHTVSVHFVLLFARSLFSLQLHAQNLY